MRDEPPRGGMGGIGGAAPFALAGGFMDLDEEEDLPFTVAPFARELLSKRLARCGLKCNHFLRDGVSARAFGLGVSSFRTRPPLALPASAARRPTGDPVL